MKHNLIFLGGTCGNNFAWRKRFFELFKEKGGTAEVFNPQLQPGEPWNEAARSREESMKLTADCQFYCVADPQNGGTSAYSMVEATMALYDNPQSVVVFDMTGLDGHNLKAANQVAKVLKARHPEAAIFDNLEDAVSHLCK